MWRIAAPMAGRQLVALLIDIWEGVSKPFFFTFLPSVWNTDVLMPHCFYLWSSHHRNYFTGNDGIWIWAFFSNNRCVTLELCILWPSKELRPEGDECLFLKRDTHSVWLPEGTLQCPSTPATGTYLNYWEAPPYVSCMSDLVSYSLLILCNKSYGWEVALLQ